MLGAAPAEESLTAEAIMARVATNQDSSEKLRSQYIYHQHIQVISKKPSGKVLREETADYHVVPKPDHTERTLEQLTGRYWHKGKYESFSGEPVPEADSTDGELVHDFRDDVTDEKSKDGLAHDLFPLTTDEQKNYKFRLLDHEPFEGRPCLPHRLSLRRTTRTRIGPARPISMPRSSSRFTFLRSSLSPCRLASGNLWGSTFPVSASRFTTGDRTMESGFPPAWAANFAFRVFFFFNRTMTVSLENKAFEHTHVQTRITGADQ